MILPQVLLRKPCYDLYFLWRDEFDNFYVNKRNLFTLQLSHESASSVVATGGVYKRQGPIQRLLMTHVYKVFRVHVPVFQGTIPVEQNILLLFTTLFRVMVDTWTNYRKVISSNTNYNHIDSQVKVALTSAL